MWDPPTSPWAAVPPPGEERHEEYYPGISTSLIGVGLSSTILAVAVVCLRLYSRIFSARGLRADDYLIVLATGFLIGFFAICVRLTVYGVGTHVWDVYLENYTPGILQLIFLSQVLGCLMVSFNKLSLLSLYITITPNKKFRAVVYSLMAFVIGFTVAYILVQILDCNPVEGQWDLRLFQTAHCIDSTVSPMQILSIVNILVDLAVVVLPIPVILPLPLPKKDKASCLLLFAAGGGLVCIAAIGRTVELSPLLHPRSSGFVDVTWLVVPELNWAFAEGSIGIIAASLPAIRPLFKRLLCKIRGTADNENDRSGMTLKDMSGGSRGSKAHRHQRWPHSKDGTLQNNLGDEELGLCPGPGRSTQGSDRISAVSENLVSNVRPHSNAAGDRSGHAEVKGTPGGRWEVFVGDFAMVHP